MQILSWLHQGLNHKPSGSQSCSFITRLPPLQSCSRSVLIGWSQCRWDIGVSVCMVCVHLCLTVTHIHTNTYMCTHTQTCKYTHSLIIVLKKSLIWVRFAVPFHSQLRDSWKLTDYQSTNKLAITFCDSELQMNIDWIQALVNWYQLISTAHAAMEVHQLRPSTDEEWQMRRVWN